VPPGDYSGSVISRAACDGSVTTGIPFVPGAVPANPDCNLGVWDYASPYDYGITPQNRRPPCRI